MSASSSKSTNRHERGNNNISQGCSKQPNMQDKEDNNDNGSAGEITTKIIDLNDDCLMKIFEYLDIQDLFHVAIANEWLRPAAAEVHRSRYGEHRIELSFFSYNYHELYKFDDTIFVLGLKTCLLYLRCFGSSINNLTVKYYVHKYVHQYINTYCVDSLKEIKFRFMPKMSILHFVKPFTNVRSVSVKHCDLGEFLPQFVEWFPNLRYLKLEAVCLTDGFDRVPFRHLEQLFIVECTQKCTYAANLLQSNRQLRSLEMDFNCRISINELLDMIKDHSLITKLNVRFTFDKALVNNSLEINRIASEHSMLVELNLRNYKFTCDCAIKLINELKPLKTFDFCMERDSDVSRFKSNLDENEWILTESYHWRSIYIRLNRKI